MVDPSLEENYSFTTIQPTGIFKYGLSELTNVGFLVWSAKGLHVVLGGSSTSTIVHRVNLANMRTNAWIVNVPVIARGFQKQGQHMGCGGSFTGR